MAPKSVDANQAEIVQALRAIGATVQDLHEVGKGCPDILVGYRDRNYLLEIKNPETKGTITEREWKWHNSWHGQVAVVWSAEEAIAVISNQSLESDIKNEHYYRRND